MVEKKNIWWYTLVSVYKKKMTTTYFSRFLRNTKLTWNKEASMVIQRLHHSSATAVPSIFQIYFKNLCFSISSAISSAQGLATPHLEYCYYLVLYIVYSFNTCELSVWHVSGTESGQEAWLREKQIKKNSAQCGARRVQPQDHSHSTLTR